MSNPFDFGRPESPESEGAKGEAADEPAWKKRGKKSEPASSPPVGPGADLKVAQGILLFVGVLSVALNAYLLVNIDEEIAEARAAGARINDTTIKVMRVVYIGATAMGAAFVVLGLIVWKAPLIVTIAGFLLYVVGNLIVLSYTNFAGGSANYVKVFFALALARAISDAAAYEREKRAEKRRQIADQQKAPAAKAGGGGVLQGEQQ